MIETESKASNKKADKKLLETARARFKRSAEHEADMRLAALEDIKFRAGEQWDPAIKAARESEGKPCLTINKTEPAIRQVTNDQRQNRPSIRISPVDDGADKATSRVYQGLIRNIEYRSDAETAYDTSFEHAADGGYGYFRVITDYVDPRSFEQEILIKRIRNRFSVYYDPDSKEPDGSDATFAFIVDEMSRDEFEMKYPNAEACSMEDWQSVGDSLGDWLKKDTVRVAEYIYKEFKNDTLLRISDGIDEFFRLKSELSDQESAELDEGLLEIVDERETRVPSVKWCLINGMEVLDRTDIPASHITVIPVLGNEIDIEGKRIVSGIIRHAKDPARMYNAWVSAETEMIGAAPKAPWLVAEGSIEGYEEYWNKANAETMAYLPYKAYDRDGNPFPQPTRNISEPPIGAITQARMLSSDDLKATTGIYDASLGNQGNETSGVAIQRRNMQAQTSNFHFVDNLTRSMKHLGRILIEMIPKVYDTPRTVRIIGEDGEEELVAINQVFQEKGQEKRYDLGVGKYDVIVDVGPSYASKRQEAAESMLQLTQSFPTIAQVAGDLMVKNMDWPGAQEIAERLKKMLPPELGDDDETEIPPAVKAKMAQMQQMLEQITNELTEAQKKLETDEIKAERELQKEQMKLESEERVAFAKLQQEANLQMAKIDSIEGIELLKQEIASINSRLSQHLDFNEPVGVEPMAPPEPLPNETLVDPAGGAMPSNPLDGEPQ